MKTIIEMAREAGFEVDEDIANVWVSDAYIGDKLERFAALVRAEAQAEEREACAKVCETLGDMNKGVYGEMQIGVYSAAKSIRARGNT